MRINQPLSNEEHDQADLEHKERAESQKQFLREVADLLESGQQLDDWQRSWAAGAIRGFAKSIPLERKRPAGKTPKVPEDALAIRYAHIKSGMKVIDAEKKLADLYGVDLDTLQDRIKRLKKSIDPKAWGLSNWDGR